MKISGFQIPDRQLKLWEIPLGNHGTVRTTIGNFVEDLTALVFGGRRHRTSSVVDYCPDVSVLRDGVTFYLECKAAGRSKQTFLYGGRLERDREFVAEGNPLLYVIWHHLADTLLASTEEELRMLFLLKMKCVYLVPFNVISAICAEREPEKLNSQYGRTAEYPKVYGSGYRISLKLLEDWKVFEWQVSTAIDSPTRTYSILLSSESTLSTSQLELF